MPKVDSKDKLKGESKGELKDEHKKTGDTLT